MLRALAENAPTVMYVHCSAGCDRTGEFIGAYAMRYLGYNVTTAMGEACRQCGRCPNYFSSSALGWWCLTEKQNRTDVGDCLDFAGCTLFKDCHVRRAQFGAARRESEFCAALCLSSLPAIDAASTLAGAQPDAADEHLPDRPRRPGLTIRIFHS